MNALRGMSTFRWILIAVGIFVGISLVLPRGSETTELEISQVLEMAEAGQVAKTEVPGDRLKVSQIEVRGDKLKVFTVVIDQDGTAVVDEDGEETAGETFKSRKEGSVSVLELLNERGIATGTNGVQVLVKSKGNSVGGILLPILPILLIGGLILFMFRRARGGMDQVTSIGKTKARVIEEDRPAVDFSNVAGVEEAKQELAEVVEFLRVPEKFTKLGAKIPRGILLVGPPGTGKTLISKAVAGEAKVPFFALSGSEFVEMFVGVGASRVRDLFSRARLQAPALIFIDEIDAVGRHRGAGIGGGNDEREQTLNQILVEMDGFDERATVIVIAATNRPDVLDPALLRPGRFDRQVVLELPDVRGREAILGVHLKGKPVRPDVDIHALAKETPGFSGADLANLGNEAAILAARAEKQEIGTEEFEEAVDRVIAGPARKSKKVSEHERTIVAYHEAGHALVASQLPGSDPVHKVTIVPRGASGGHTRLVSDEERGLWSKSQLEAMLAVTMGGQAAEELVCEDITTGASSDLQNATNVARKMVTEYGMSAELGPQTFDRGQGHVFLGKELAQGHNYSEAVAARIDDEVSKLLRNARETAKSLILENREILTRLAERLLVEETVHGAELQGLLTGTPETVPVKT